MSTPHLLVVQPDPSDPLGPLGDWLTSAGARLDVRQPPADELPETTEGYDGVVCLGGGMNATDDERHPWLADVRRLLNRAAVADLPTLGVCLGAQLLAVANGGTAVRADTPEVGPGLVAKKDAAWSDPLFADLPLMQDVVQFHVDAVERLPNGAVLLASSPKCQHQAYRVGRRVYGLQFHIETTPDVVRAWADDAPDVAAHARTDALAPDTLAEVHADIAETWQPFAERFVRLVAGELEPASDRARGLPLA